MRIVKAVAVLSIATMSACSAVGDNGPDIIIEASEEGLAALMDGHNGLVQTGKSAPNEVTEWGNLRQAQGLNRTKRHGLKYLKPAKGGN